MQNKELDKMCSNCEKGLAFKKVRCPFRSISNEYCEEYKKLRNDVEILEILKRNLYVEKGTGKFKGIEIIQCSLGNQHSKDFNKIKEWLKNENCDI